MTSPGLVRPAARAGYWPLVATAVAVAAAVLLGAAYLARAWVLVAYPWDWSPQEGMHLDYARRALVSPASLYRHSTVPFPSAYGPLLPLMMAPLVNLARPLAAARVFLLVSTIVGTAAIARILHRQAGPLWALCGVALYLAPFDLSFWHMLVRVDGPMIALWLGAAALLLPRELSRGADALSTPRLFAGACMLLGSVLIKPTAALHGAPLVLGWWLVDRRSALRLAITTTALGCAALAALQWLTSGGFLWVNRLWLVHSRVPGQASRILLSFVAVTWPVLALTGSGGAAGVALGFQAPEGRLAAPRRRRPCGRADDGETGRVLELSHPAVRGSRAAGRLLVREACQARQLGADTRWSPTCAAGLLALALASTHPFPLPTAADAETARAFYRHVLELHRLAPGPMLVSRPDLLYFLAKQPEEVDGASGAIRYSSRPGR